MKDINIRQFRLFEKRLKEHIASDNAFDKEMRLKLESSLIASASAAERLNEPNQDFFDYISDCCHYFDMLNELDGFYDENDDFVFMEESEYYETLSRILNKINEALPPEEYEIDCPKVLKS